MLIKSVTTTPAIKTQDSGPVLFSLTHHKYMKTANIAMIKMARNALFDPVK
jgi:hypothetical protein